MLTDNGTSKKVKTYANRIIRAKLKTGKYDGVGLGLTDYKKMFETYAICDYRFRKDRWDLENDIAKNGKPHQDAWIEYKKKWLCK